MKKIFLLFFILTSLVFADVKSDQEQFIKVADKVMDSVVNISTEKTIKSKYTDPFQDMFNDPFFGRYFGQQGTEKEYTQKATSLGSGFVITQDGYIMTNYHVVSEADKIDVKFSDKEVYKAKLIGADPETDIAILKIDGGNNKFQPVDFGDSDNLKIGQWAIAIGNPFGLNNTMTVGIVSAKGRSGMGIETYEDFIQTDASINPGNSGGPLVDIDGKVIGVNTAILSQSGGNMGIGFAIPVNMAKSIKDMLIKDGKVTRGYLGIMMQPVDKNIAQKFNLKRSSGVLITNVVPGSPAESAGLKRGDIIIDADGKKISEMGELINSISNSMPGKEMTFTVVRDGKETKIKAKLAKKEENSVDNNAVEGSILGMKIRNIDDTVKQKFNLPKDKKGVIVLEVAYGSSAYLAGIRAGDVVVAVEKNEVSSVGEVNKILSQIPSGQDILLFVEGKNLRYVILTKE